jgi:hypothetical protein
LWTRITVYGARSAPSQQQELAKGRGVSRISRAGPLASLVGKRSEEIEQPRRLGPAHLGSDLARVRVPLALGPGSEALVSTSGALGESNGSHTS